MLLPEAHCHRNKKGYTCHPSGGLLVQSLGVVNGISQMYDSPYSTNRLICEIVNNL